MARHGIGGLRTSLKRFSGEKITIRDHIGEWWYNLWRYTWGFSHIRDAWWFLRHRLWDRYDLIPTKLDKGSYHDIPETLLHGMMELVVRFVEDEKAFERVDFKQSGTQWVEAGEDIKEVYNWWKDYPNRVKEIDIALDNWSNVAYDKTKDFIEQLNHNKLNTPEIKRYSEIYDFLQIQLKEEETIMLHKVVNIKEFLWT